MHGITATLLILALSPVPLDGAKDDANLARHIYPLSKPLVTPKVVLDVSAVPTEREWGEMAKQIVVDWYPTVTSLLATEKFDSPKQIRLVIKKDMPVPAANGGAEIALNGKWIHDHPDDFGMVVHELVHVVQAYPSDASQYGWLIEGIADYVRWWRYEPEAPRPTIEKGQTYHDSYRTTAAFLAWSVRTYDKRIVSKLDRALRMGEDPAVVFETVTGRKFEKAWEEYVANPR